MGTEFKQFHLPTDFLANVSPTLHCCLIFAMRSEQEVQMFLSVSHNPLPSTLRGL